MNKRSKNCPPSNSDGKGNIGKFIERFPRVVAAGLRTSQPNDSVNDALQQYLLQDEVDALKSDAIIPPEPHKQPDSRREKLRDMRNAGPFSNVASIINPPIKTKFQSLVEDFKNTVYRSYWEKPVGTIRDPVPSLPVGFDIYGTTLGKKLPHAESLYDVILPKDPLPQQTPVSKLAGQRTNRNYCRPPFNPDMTFGIKQKKDPRGKFMKCGLQDDRQVLGTANYTYMNAIQADFIFENKSRLAKVLAPNNNIDCVPKGFAFGTLKQPTHITDCMSHCRINTKREKLLECLAHLNTLRKFLKKRFDGPFFRSMYRKLKYIDTNNTGWLPKDTVYNYCHSYYIRFNPELIEPLLACWEAFNGSEIKYKTFVQVLSPAYVCPELPKVWSVPEECIDYRTTYSEMVKPEEPDTSRRAGLPSGRYFDKDYPVTPDRCCKADRFYLPQETDGWTCLCPSILTLSGVTHRDMFAERTPEVVKKVFSKAGEKFTDKQFEEIWDEAKKYHSQGAVCFETFRRALKKYNASEK